MRRLFAVIFAIMLAFLVTGALSLYEKGVPFGELSLQTIKEAFQDKVSGDNARNLPLLPTNTGEEKQKEEQNLSYDERIEKGDYYMERGFLSFAANEYVRAANLEPNRAEPHLKLLDANYELRDYKKALGNAESVLKLQPNHYETRLTMAKIYLKQSDFDTARTLLENLPPSPRAAPDGTPLTDPRVGYYKGLLKSAFGDHDDAKKLLRQAMSDSKDPVLNDKIDHLLQAYTEFEFAQSAEPLYLSELLARAYNKAGEYELAVHTLKEVLKTRNDLRDGWVLFGFAYLNLGKYAFAQTAFERAYELDSEWPTTQYFLGLTYQELERNEDAIIFFNYALANQFDPPVVIHRHLADLYFDTGQHAKAVEAYEKVLEINQDDLNAFVRPIWLYLDYLKSPESALKLAQKAAAAFPEDAMSYNLLGWSQTGAREYLKAEENLKKAIEIDPSLAAAHYNLGKLYQAQNRKRLALEAYQEAYDLDQSGSIGNLAAQQYNDLLSQ